jgi:hypothetical protein
VGTTYVPRPAERQQARLRMALAGPSGGGKTHTALLFASALGERICLIDAERGSAQLYAGLPNIPAFDIIVLGDCTPEDYCAALEAAQDYDVAIVDSISPEWIATLDIAEEATEASRSKNSYTSGWRIATPRHNRFVRQLMTVPSHLIATIRQKTKYILQDSGYGGQVPKRVGWEWVQRDLLEFEFDLCAELDFDNTLVVTKTRCQALQGAVARKPTADFMTPVKAWLSTGRQMRTLKELFAAVKADGYGEDDLKLAMARLTPGVDRFRDLSFNQIETLYEYFTTMVHTNGQG